MSKFKCEHCKAEIEYDKEKHIGSYKIAIWTAEQTYQCKKCKQYSRVRDEKM